MTTYTNGDHAPEMPDYMNVLYDQFSAPPPTPTKQPAGPAPEVALIPRQKRFKPTSLAGLLARPPFEWMIENIIGSKDTMMIYGPSGCGKTFVVIDLIFAACLGQQFAMRFDIARPLNVAYAAGEGLGGLPKRFAAAAAFYGVDDLPNFTFYDNTPQLFQADSPDSMKVFVDEYKEHQEAGEIQPLDILFIDTLHAASLGANENDGKDNNTILQWCKYAKEQLNCAICLVHHTNKAGELERGHTSLRAAMDAMIKVNKADGKGSLAYISCGKAKDGQEWESQSFSLVEKEDSVRVFWNSPAPVEDGDKRKGQNGRIILQLLNDRAGAKLTAKQISEATSIGPTAVNKVMARIEKDELITRGQTPHGTWCFAITDKGKEAIANPNNPI